MRFGLWPAVVAVIVPAARAQRVGSGSSGPPVRIADSLATRVDAVFADVDRTASPGCALGVVRGGALIYERGYGMANLDDGVPERQRWTTRFSRHSGPAASTAETDQ